MSLLSDLLQNETQGAANSATPAKQPHETEGATASISNCSKISKVANAKNDKADHETEGTYSRLLQLAKAKGYAPALVHQLSEADLADCNTATDETLTSYLHALQTTADRKAGIVPEGYNDVAYCEECGPVWLFTPGAFHGCPWCWNRAHGKPIPRPPVRCIDCRYFNRASHAHLGHCAKGQAEPPAGLWDSDSRTCERFAPDVSED
jgi:hypothetical protein